MRTDLIRGYFERDLTEAEEQLLADQIAASPEAALLLAEEAKAFYTATGLPQPDWDHLAPAATGTAAGLLKGLLVGALLTGAVWYYFPRPVADTPPVPETVTDPVPAAPAVKKAVAPVAPKTSQPAPTMAPQRFVPGRKYEGLSVIVAQKAAGLVTVRVLGPQGEEVRLLFAGMLPSGDWTFEWDGRVQDGDRAPEGTYTVETQSGRSRLQKQIVISQPQ